MKLPIISHSSLDRALMQSIKDAYDPFAQHVSIGNLLKINLLLFFGANPNLEGGSHLSYEPSELPLVSAACHGMTPIVEILIRNGADVNKQESSTDCTALMAASINLHIKTVNLLLENKANVNAKDYRGMTALFKTLKHATRSTESSVLEVIKLLIEYGANVDIQNNHGETALMEFIPGYSQTEIGNEIAKQLIISGDINLKTKHGTSALMLAAKWGRAKVVQMLIDADADVEAKDKDGKTALEYAAAFSYSRECTESDKERSNLIVEMLSKAKQGKITSPDTKTSQSALGEESQQEYK